VEIAHGDKKTKPLETPTTLNVQVQSCEEGLDKVIKILKNSFPDPKILECKEEGPESFAKVGTITYVYNSNHLKSPEELPGIFGLVAGLSGFDDTILGETISIYMNIKNFEVLSDRIESEFK